MTLPQLLFFRVSRDYHIPTIPVTITCLGREEICSSDSDPNLTSSFPFKQIRQPERYVSSHYVQQRHQKTTHIYKTQTHEKKVHLSKYDCSELSGNAKQCNTQAQSTCTQGKSVYIAESCSPTVIFPAQLH